MYFRAWFGELGTVSRTRIVQEGPQMRCQSIIFRWHHCGIAAAPACQKAQMFFSDVTGLCLDKETRMASSLRESRGSATSS